MGYLNKNGMFTLPYEIKFINKKRYASDRLHKKHNKLKR